MPWVEEHERGGTKVRRYFRWVPEARRGLSILVLLGIAVAGYGGSTGTASSDGPGSRRVPRPTSTATYPVHFGGWDDPKPAPKPTVLYPIRFET